MQSEPVTGIILAGGKSSRFGSDKAMYNYDGKALINHAIEVLKPICSELLLSTNSPEGYFFTGLNSIVDIHLNCGPLGGIHSGLCHANNEHILIIGCDMPGMQTALYQTILNNKKGVQAVVPVYRGQPEPLAAYFHISALPFLENAILKRQFKLTQAISPLSINYLNVDELAFNSDELFMNINSQSDLCKTRPTRL